MIKFGTGGWRAIIGDEFIKSNIQLLAKAMADKMKAENVADQGVVMGYDRRFLSKETIMWCCEVFAAEGITVHFVNRSVPTPLIMYYVEKYDFPYGMMVTASHNPSLYNGIKVFTAGGRDADETQTNDIEAYIARIDETKIQRISYDAALERGLVKLIYPMNEYVDSIMNKIDIEAIKRAQLRIVIDPMFGVGKAALNTILTSGRCDLEIIHQEHDTLFGRKVPAPSEERLGLLRHSVIDMEYDMGLAMDGDADRLGVIDEKGNYLHPNDILVLLYYYLLKHKGWQGPVVRNLATTHRLDAIARKFGQQCYEVPVGFKHISAKMSETGAVLGGESSGGLTVTGHINGKDGVYAASLLVEMCAVTGKKLSELMRIIEEECGGTAYMVEQGYTFQPEAKAVLLKLLYEDKVIPDMSSYEIDHVSYMDGCKVYFKNGGWVIARFSGTEPLLRVFSEMPKKAEAEDVCDRFKALIEKYSKLS